MASKAPTLTPRMVHAIPKRAPNQVRGFVGPPKPWAWRYRCWQRDFAKRHGAWATITIVLVAILASTGAYYVQGSDSGLDPEAKGESGPENQSSTNNDEGNRDTSNDEDNEDEPTGGGDENDDDEENRAPTALSMVSPSNGATGVNPAGVTLQYTALDPDGDALQFTVKLDTTNPPPTTACTDAGTSCPTGELETDTTYYWRVTVNDPLGLSVAGPVWSFTTASEATENQPPTAPTDPTPADDAVEQDPDGVTLSWAASTDPDGDSIEYRVLLKKYGTPTENDVLCDWDSTAACPTGVLEEGIVYHWLVQARDADTPAAGPEWTFMTAMEESCWPSCPPEPPVGVSMG